MKLSVRIIGARLLFLPLLASLPGMRGNASDETTPDLSVPIPIGHGAKGVKLPYFDEKGKLQMDFSIDSAYRIDSDHLQMTMVKMQTYDESGKLEMMIDMPSSILDLTTRIVSSDKPVTIRRSDFELTGDTMQFNTQTKSGKIVGNVRMLIFNSGEMAEKKGAE